MGGECRGLIFREALRDELGPGGFLPASHEPFPWRKAARRSSRPESIENSLSAPNRARHHHPHQQIAALLVACCCIVDAPTTGTSASTACAPLEVNDAWGFVPLAAATAAANAAPASSSPCFQARAPPPLAAWVFDAVSAAREYADPAWPSL